MSLSDCEVINKDKKISIFGELSRCFKGDQWKQ